MWSLDLSGDVFTVIVDSDILILGEGCVLWHGVLALSPDTPSKSCSYKHTGETLVSFPDHPSLRSGNETYW